MIMCNKSTIPVSELDQRLAQLQDMLEEHYMQLGKDILDLTVREQIAIDKIVTEIVSIKKQIRGAQ